MEDDVSSEPLSEHELRALRRIIISDNRARWFWASARIYVSWILGAPPAIYGAYIAFQKLFGMDTK